MCCGNEELSPVLISMSRGAGACVGTVAAAGKKVTGIFTGGFSVIGNMLTRSAEPLEEAEQTVVTEPDVSAEGNLYLEKKKSAKSLISSLESDLAAARSQLKETQSKAEKDADQSHRLKCRRGAARGQASRCVQRRERSSSGTHPRLRGLGRAACRGSSIRH